MTRRRLTDLHPQSCTSHSVLFRSLLAERRSGTSVSTSCFTHNRSLAFANDSRHHTSISLFDPVALLALVLKPLSPLAPEMALYQFHQHNLFYYYYYFHSCPRKQLLVATVCVLLAVLSSPAGDRMQQNKTTSPLSFKISFSTIDLGS